MNPLIALAADTAAKGTTALINERLQHNSMRYQDRLNRGMVEFQDDKYRQLLSDEMSLKAASYRKAGLSMAALAGQFGGNVAQPTAMGVSPTNGTMQAPSLADALGAAKLEAEIENIKADTRNKNSQSNATDIEAQLRAKYGDEVYKKQIANMSAEEKLKLAEADKAIQEKYNSISMTVAKVRDIEERLQMDWKKLDPTLAVLAAEAIERVANANLSVAKADECYQNIRESVARISKMSAEEAEIYSRVMLTLQEFLTEIQETSGKTSEATIKKIEAAADEIEGPAGLKVREWLGPLLNIFGLGVSFYVGSRYGKGKQPVKGSRMKKK